jgi:hypothetical protein
MTQLTAEKALIFRIVHRDNIESIFRHSLQSISSLEPDSSYTSIGNDEIIDRRKHKQISLGSGGNYSDYIPFYFTPYSIMMHNILTGFNVPMLKKEDILIVVSSLIDMDARGYEYVFTNQHALSQTDLQFFNKLEELSAIDWELLNSRDFKRDPDDPGKLLRYQAEAMIKGNLPLSEIRGLVCYNETIQEELSRQAAQQNLDLTIKVLPKWYT